MAPPTYTLTPTAYALALSHAAAHPSSTVLGLLLAPTPSATSAVLIDDAIPLVHRYASLSLTAELGLDLVRARAKRAGRQIVGVYVAQADGDRTEGPPLGRAGASVLAAIREHVFSGAVGLVLDNDKLAASQPAFVPADTATVVALPDARTSAAALALIREKRVHSAIRDLDDHLDDARVEWMENATVRKAVSALA